MANSDIIYLDYNATAPIRPEVIEIMAEVMIEGGNPSSVHVIGRKAKSRLEEARSLIASTINCRPQMLIFTSGGTEANNMAVLSSSKKRLITTNSEHDSIRSAASRFNGKVDMVSIDRNGILDIKELAEHLKSDGDDTIVSILYANNETGVLQNIRIIADLVHDAGALLHIDAIQAFAKIEIDFMALGCDMMSLSAHKIGGPQGVGALVTYEKLSVVSPILGGGQEVGRRGGTENIAGIAGFGMAASMVPKSLDKMEMLKLWRNQMEADLLAHSNEAIILGQNAPRLPNVSMIYMPGVLSDTQVMNFDLDKICVSAGSACSSGRVKSSAVIKAMTGEDKIAMSTVRMSLGWESEKEEVDRFVKCWFKQYDKKHKRQSTDIKESSSQSA